MTTMSVPRSKLRVILFIVTLPIRLWWMGWCGIDWLTLRDQIGETPGDVAFRFLLKFLYATITALFIALFIAVKLGVR